MAKVSTRVYVKKVRISANASRLPKGLPLLKPLAYKRRGERGVQYAYELDILSPEGEVLGRLRYDPLKGRWGGVRVWLELINGAQVREVR